MNASSSSPGLGAANDASSDATTTASNPARSLRGDLGGLLTSHGARKARIIADEISGQFARVPERVWQSLVRGEGDQQAWHQAASAGWTRDRARSSGGAFSLLYIRVPLINIDALASALSRHCNWIFGQAAVKFWTCMIVIAALFSLSRYSDVAASVAKLPSFFTQSNTWVLAAIFLTTKLFHEMGHAVACRRSGFRCGKMGVLLLCGIPCPYCDVTQVWKSPHPRSRACVMLAGMYIEGILATMATLVWATTQDPLISLHAMNVMIVCSVSTIVFNANPLMRYDGYYVLSDWVDSVQLRSEARQASHAWLASTIENRCFPGTLNHRTAGLLLYHMASTAYRFLMLGAIGAAVLVYAEAVELRLAAIVGLLTLVIAMAAKVTSRFLLSSSANTSRNGVTMMRKLASIGVSMFVLGIVLCVPIPRQASLSGYMDAADSTKVYLASDGLIDGVAFNIGDEVKQGDWLVRVRDDQSEIDIAGLQSKLRVASLRRQAARRRTLENSGASEHFETLRAVEDAVSANLVSLRERSSQQLVLAPVSGMLLPSSVRKTSKQTRLANDQGFSDLTGEIGSSSKKGRPWCRIGQSKELGIVLTVEASYRGNVEVGMTMRASEVQSPHITSTYLVKSISSISSDQNDVSGSSTFELWCQRLNATNPISAQRTNVDNDFLSRLGAPCRAVLDLPARSLGQDLAELIRDMFS